MAEADDVKYDGSGIVPPHIKDKIEDAPELEPNEDRYRITVRGDNIELRGYIDINEVKTLNDFAAALRPFGIVVASYAGPDYDPFGIDQPEHP